MNIDYNKRELTRIANELVLKDIPIPSLPNDHNTLFVIKLLEDHLVKLKSQRTLMLPNLTKDNKTIMILSDYGGESSDSNYLTYSFLFVAYDALSFWFDESKKIRIAYKLNDPHKEIAFKDLSYGPIDRCLDDWLNIADYLPGLLFTLVVSKQVISSIGTQDKQAMKKISKIMKNNNLGTWKPKIAEKLIRVLHPICYWISILSRDGQKLFWMTDDDAIIANREKADSLGKLFVSILSIYTNNKYARVGYAKPFDNNNDALNFNDLLSIPDLVAGSIESLYTKKYNNENPLVKEGTNRILRWHAHQGVGLKKYAMIVDAVDDKQYRSGMVEFEVTDKTRDIQCIPVWL